MLIKKSQKALMNAIFEASVKMYSCWMGLDLTYNIKKEKIGLIKKNARKEMLEK